MAWIDDRIWCHPKFTELSGPAGWLWTKGVAYSTGFGTKGVLTAGQQQLIGATAKTRRELVDAGLWDELGDGTVGIHDWDDHNSKRDARREADRERKRAQRQKDKSGVSPQDSPQDEPQDGRQDRRALKEVKEVTEKPGALRAAQPKGEPAATEQPPVRDIITTSLREIA